MKFSIKLRAVEIPLDAVSGSFTVRTLLFSPMFASSASDNGVLSQGSLDAEVGVASVHV